MHFSNFISVASLVSQRGHIPVFLVTAMLLLQVCEFDHDHQDKSPPPSQGLTDTVRGQRAEGILVPYSMDLTELRPGLGK